MPIRHHAEKLYFKDHSRWHSFLECTQNPSKMDSTTHAITALTSLIEVNAKRMKTYQSLAAKTREEELKVLFNQWAEQSKLFTRSLSNWRAAYGGFAVTEKKSTFTKAWTQMRSLVEAGFIGSAIAQSREIENQSLTAYRTTIGTASLPAATLADVERQTREFERAIVKLSALKS
jgi:uncharacterized protein (TIGR02284 family)